MTNDKKELSDQQTFSYIKQKMLILQSLKIAYGESKRKQGY